MGWVSPRLGERSITCEPKGEEIGAHTTSTSYTNTNIPAVRVISFSKSYNYRRTHVQKRFPS